MIPGTVDLVTLERANQVYCVSDTLLPLTSNLNIDKNVFVTKMTIIALIELRFVTMVSSIKSIFSSDTL